VTIVPTLAADGGGQGFLSKSVAVAEPEAPAVGDRTCPVCGSHGLGIPRYRKVGLARCADCGLIFHSRTPADARDAYVNGEYVARHVDYVEEERAARHIAEQRASWLLGFTSPGPLLELGSGRGFFLDAARRRGFEPLGIEPSPDLVDRAQDEFGVAVKQGFLEEVDLSGRHFTSVCMFHVLEHVEEPVALLGQLVERLAGPGLIVLEVPNIASAMARRRAEGWGAVQPDNLHITQFTPSTLCGAVERAGFEVIAIDTISPWHYIPPADRWRHRALLGYAYRAATLRTLKVTHSSGFDHLRLIARRP
jgi:2-polyprenyl-3-methyl-5-hydroxy-6-metoxy-1,4-benzoquinol methylase